MDYSFCCLRDPIGISGMVMCVLYAEKNRNVTCISPLKGCSVPYKKKIHAGFYCSDKQPDSDYIGFNTLKSNVIWKNMGRQTTVSLNAVRSKWEGDMTYGSSSWDLGCQLVMRTACRNGSVYSFHSPVNQLYSVEIMVFTTFHRGTSDN